MAYIGNIPATSFEAVKKDRFTGLTGTSVTLSHSVSTVQDIVLWINAVKQDYTSYSVNGTALTVGGSLVSSDIVEVAYLGRTFQTVNPSAGSVGLSQLSATGTKSSSTFLRGDNTFDTPPLGGITEADQWRLTADLVGSNATVSSNLERVDDASFAKIGTGMTVSSGIWSFPSTGLYQIFLTANIYTSSQDNVYLNLYVTQNNSSYDRTSRVGLSSSNNYETLGTAIGLVNVTNTSNVKVKFTTSSFDSDSGLQGDTNRNETCFMFIRLGDSQ